MSTRTRWLWLLALICVGLGHAQTVHVNLPPTYELYYVGDLDPRGDMTGIGNEITVSVSNVPAGTWSLDVTLTFGRNADNWIARGHLNPFTSVTGNLGPWTLNEIRNGTVSGFSGSGKFNSDFLNQISGNSLPSGLYALSVVLTAVPGGQTTTGEGSFVIDDPRRIDLQTPWDGAVAYTDQPTFSWSGRALNYRLRVCEYDSEFHGSPQEALAGEPMWIWDLPTDNDPTSVVYGQGGGSARPLQEGHQYVWMVEAVLRTTSGERTFPSAIRTFRLNQSQGGVAEPELISLLEGLTPGQLAGIGGLLEGYHLNGSILIDGQPVSVEEFEALLRRLASGELNIASIRIE